MRNDDDFFAPLDREFKRMQGMAYTIIVIFILILVNVAVPLIIWLWRTLAMGT